ncbi:clan AA aspartic protease [Planctomicrobium sp.]|nr:clan AA aspartic protease [Planctomicrobium sp.]MDA7504093.1 clan AA aspartic protease [bacterium]MDA7527647.1 clan AA aspartic protease [bacterium]MDB4743008.1 clan AA aspartic protease [Planctomicrobium sp.]
MDGYGRALLKINIRSTSGGTATSVDAWVDTGFTGDLVISNSLVEQLELKESGSVDAILADSSPIELPTYTCIIDWFGHQRRLEVVANDGEYPLLGVGLLIGMELRVNYATLNLSLKKN